jgi:hypothetical protein
VEERVTWSHTPWPRNFAVSMGASFAHTAHKKFSILTEQIVASPKYHSCFWFLIQPDRRLVTSYTVQGLEFFPLFLSPSMNGQKFITYNKFLIHFLYKCMKVTYISLIQHSSIDGWICNMSGNVGCTMQLSQKNKLTKNIHTIHVVSTQPCDRINWVVTWIKK